jgi:hypothetical protein
VTGFVLIGTHLGLVLWEAAGAYEKAEPRAHPAHHSDTDARTPIDARS